MHLIHSGTDRVGNFTFKRLGYYGNTQAGAIVEIIRLSTQINQLKINNGPDKLCFGHVLCLLLSCECLICHTRHILYAHLCRNNDRTMLAPDTADLAVIRFYTIRLNILTGWEYSGKLYVISLPLPTD